jgi:hypothetical protein
MCHHTSGWRYSGGSDWHNLIHYDPNTYPDDYYWKYDAWSVPVIFTSGFGATTNNLTPPVEPGMMDELMDAVYTDIAGRSNEYLLSLEDFAGFFSGKSLWKSIRSVAAASNLVARGIDQCRKLGRQFGWKHGLYNLWLSSRDAVREAIGLRLGYRFSFKTTLNDIVKAVDFSADYANAVSRIIRRNDSSYLMYSKRDSAANQTIDYFSGNQLKGVLFYFNDTLRSWFAGQYAKGIWESTQATVLKRARLSCKAFCRAKVRYPADYASMRHYFEGKFGLDKPLTTLWAIVPLSFVVDYLLNVQDCLSYVDNKLNDYLVASWLQTPWTCKTVDRQSILDIPERQGVVSWDPGIDSRRTNAYDYPHVHEVITFSSEFTRNPVLSSSIRAQFPSLIKGDSNWVQRVGTGLELLVSSRLR